MVEKTFQSKIFGESLKMSEPKEVTVAFPKKGYGLERVTVPLTAFAEANSQVVAFSREDERYLSADLGELRKAGVEGVVHIVNQLTQSGLMIARALSSKIRESDFYIQVHYVLDRNLKRIDRSPL